jgi:oxygen-dependent protoporphyrinogen oxidase
MSRIIERLGEHLGGRVRTSTGVTRLARTQEGYEVEIEGPEVMSADAVVLTVPSPAAAEILTHLAPQAAHQLRAIAHASVAVIALAYEPDALPLDGSTSGFLVPSWAGKTLSAATWWSLKWPHTGTSDRVIVRCFVGRTGSDPALALDNEALAHAAATDIQDVLGTAARPTASKVTRWLDGLPQYQVGHLGRLAAIEGTLATLPGVALAGADYRGSGIPDCIRQGTEAAERVLRTTSRAAVG